VSNFIATNNSIPGRLAPIGLGLVVGAGSAAANDLCWITLFQWARQGFGAVTIGATTWTGIESVIITAATNVMAFAAVVVGYQARFGIESLMCELPLYEGGTLGDLYGERLYNLYLNIMSRPGPCNNEGR
jgi:hypothetical protein